MTVGHYCPYIPEGAIMAAREEVGAIYIQDIIQNKRTQSWLMYIFHSENWLKDYISVAQL